MPRVSDATVLEKMSLFTCKRTNGSSKRANGSSANGLLETKETFKYFI